MKKGIILLVAAVLAACGGPVDKNLQELETKRDSLITAQLKVQKEINSIEQQIAELDTTLNPADIKLLKQITMQKNRIAATELKIKKIEGEMSKKDHNKFTAVSVKELKGETFKHYLITYGNVEAINYAMVSPEMNGRIQTINVRDGEYVTKGQLLLSLNTDAVGKQIKGLKTNLELARTTFEKQDALWEQGIGSEIAYLSSKSNVEALEAQLEALEAQVRMSQIRAPFSGTVDKIYSKKGEMAGPAFPVLEMVNLGRLTINADVSETYVGQVKNGDMVEITFASLPGDTIITPVKRVSKIINSKSRTFEIEVSLDNPGNKIKPNMVSSIHINNFAAKDTLVVPSLVIRQDINGSYVYTVEEKEDKNIINKVYVETDLSYQDNTLIKGGLKKGDKVVVEGYHLVSNGQEVNIID